MIPSKKQNIISSVNKNFVPIKKKEKELDYYIQGLVNKDRFVLSECITLLESHLKTKRRLGVGILNALPKSENKTIRIGITGTPGVGKSTFIEVFGMFLIAKGHRPAVLAIDPSSQWSQGSILGDKTRMDQLSVRSEAYIRPTATGNVLGGTAFHTKEAVQLCEAAGFDVVIIETVGVGQSEVAVGDISDINLLLLQPGAGDDIQGIKRGIVENADVFIINKSDGHQKELAKQTKQAYANALTLFHHPLSGWNCPIILVSSIESTGLDQVYDQISAYLLMSEELGEYSTQRQHQEQKWFEKQTLQMVQDLVFENKTMAAAFMSLGKKVAEGHLHTSEALIQMEKMIKAHIKID